MTNENLETTLVNLSVLEYSDYREFLKAHFKHTKKRNPKWSLGAWSKALQLRTRSSMAKILQGNRKIGPQIEEKLIRFFRFNPMEARYFSDLIRITKSHASVDLRQVLHERYQARSQRTEHTVDEKKLSYFSRWYMPVIAEMARIRNQKMEPAEIAAKVRPRLTVAEVEEALSLLTSVGILIRRPDGGFDSPDWVYAGVTNPEVARATRSHYCEILGIARGALETVPMKKREFTWDTFLMKPENIAKAQLLITEFRERFMTLAEDPAGTEVFQLQIQLLPVTGKPSDA